MLTVSSSCLVTRELISLAGGQDVIKSYKYFFYLFAIRKVFICSCSWDSIKLTQSRCPQANVDILTPTSENAQHDTCTHYYNKCK